jgi:ketosteroid isomerase-like protein
MLGALFAKREVRKGFKAMMRHDADKLMGMIHDDGVLEFPGSTVLAGRYEGKEAFRAWFERWFERMPEIRFTLNHVSVEKIFALGATNTLYVEWDLEERDHDGNSYQLSGVTAFDVVGGKAKRVKEYIFDPTVLEARWPEKGADVG